jgi:hypothetical protein
MLLPILVLAVLIITGSCATRKKSYVSVDEVFNELTGTWYNEEYENPTLEARPKVIVHSGGSYDLYKEYAETTAPSHNTGRFVVIKEAWTDLKGNIWYQARIAEDWTDQLLFETGKISDSGNVWEYVWSSTDFPDKIDSENPNNRIYYRQ